MASPAALTKAQDAFNKIAELSDKQLNVDEFTLARLERDAQESLSVDPVNAYQALALIASQRWDENGLKAHYKAALQLEPRADLYSNFGRALADVNDLDAALEAMEIAARKEPENLGYLRALVNWCFCAGAWQKAREMHRLLGERTGSDMQLSTELIELADFAERIGVKPETVQKTMGCATRFLAGRKIRISTFSHSAERSAGDECIYFSLLVPLSPAEARRLDDELTPTLFDEVDDLQLGLFALTIDAVHDHEAN